jgi:hypothetical protein
LKARKLVFVLVKKPQTLNFCPHLNLCPSSPFQVLFVKQRRCPPWHLTNHLIPCVYTGFYLHTVRSAEQRPRDCQIIASKKKERRGPRKSVGSNAGANKKKASSTTKAAKKGKASIIGNPAPSVPTPVAVPSVTGNATKINVSNLPPDVKETEIRVSCLLRVPPTAYQLNF